MAVDIGGTLAKLCYLRSSDPAHPLEKAPNLTNLRSTYKHMIVSISST